MLTRITLFVAALLSAISMATVQVGETVPNLCYTDINNHRFCLDDQRGNVTVLLYNAGWCPPCNVEMGELSRAYPEFENDPVVMASLSVAGNTHGSFPSSSFLHFWQDKHDIPFVVAASPGDPGKHFNGPPHYIPNCAIIDQNGVLAAKGLLGTHTILSKVRSLLQ